MNEYTTNKPIGSTWSNEFIFGTESCYCPCYCPCHCPQYPKLIDAKEMIKKLARGAVSQETGENADYFSSVKCDGEEFNVYIRENKKI